MMMKLIILVFIIGLGTTKADTLEHISKAVNSPPQILCKKDGQIYEATHPENKDLCFDSFYWGGVCITGDIKKAFNLLNKSFPLQTQFRSIQKAMLVNQTIQYSGRDKFHNIQEKMSITYCNNSFFK